jgi:hypothetical protein
MAENMLFVVSYYYMLDFEDTLVFIMLLATMYRIISYPTCASYAHV